MLFRQIQYNLLKLIKSDFLVESFRYLIRHKKIPNFKNPKTFNEKLGHCKLYSKPDFRTSLCDKYLVKNYVRAQIGNKYVLETLFVTSEPESIPFKENILLLKRIYSFEREYTHFKENILLLKRIFSF